MPTIQDEIKIEINELHLDMVRQPQLMLKYADDYVTACSYREELKAKLEFKEAEIELEIRTYPDRFSIEKVTEATVQAALAVQPDIQELKRELLQAKEAADRLQAFKEVLQQRKSMLETLAQLWIAKYWSDVKIPEAVTDSEAKRFAEGFAKRARAHIKKGA